MTTTGSATDSRQSTQEDRQPTPEELCDRLEQALLTAGLEKLIPTGRLRNRATESRPLSQETVNTVIAFTVVAVLGYTQGVLLARQLGLGWWAALLFSVGGMAIITLLIVAFSESIGATLLIILGVAWLGTLVFELLSAARGMALVTHGVPVLALVLAWAALQLPLLRKGRLEKLFAKLGQLWQIQLSRRPGHRSSAARLQVAVLWATSMTFGLLLVRRPQLELWNHVPAPGGWAYLAAPVAVFAGLVLVGIIAEKSALLRSGFMPALYLTWGYTLVHEVLTKGASSAVLTHGVPVAVGCGIVMLLSPNILRHVSLLVPVALLVLLLPLFSSELWKGVVAADPRHVLAFAAVTIVPLGVFLYVRLVGDDWRPKAFAQTVADLREHPEAAVRGASRELETTEWGPLIQASVAAGRRIPGRDRKPATVGAYEQQLLTASFVSPKASEYAGFVDANMKRSIRRPTALRLGAAAVGVLSIFACYIYLLAVLIIRPETVRDWTGTAVAKRSISVDGHSLTLLGGPYFSVAAVLGLVATAVFFAFSLTQDEFSRDVRRILLGGQVEHWLLIAIPYLHLRVGDNDQMRNAMRLTGQNDSVTDSNRFASKEFGEPDHAGNPGGKSVWYRWTAPRSGTVTFDTDRSSFNTLLAVYRGNDVRTLKKVVANDNYHGDKSLVAFAAKENHEYLIAVDGFNGASGDIELQWRYPPANDGFANPESLSGPSGVTRGNNTFASKEPGEPDHADNQGGKSVWYRWTAPQSETVTIDTAESNFDTLLAVYRGTALNSLLVVAKNDDHLGQGSQVSFPAIRGVDYLIAVDGSATDGAAAAFGEIVLRWRLGGPAANDMFADAEPLSGPRGVVHGDTTTAMKEPGEPDHGGEVGGRSIWYRWTAPDDGPVTVDTAGSAFETLLAVYQGDAVDRLTELAAGVNGQGRGVRLTFQAKQGIDYLIAVDGRAGAFGSVTLSWRQGSPANAPFAGAEPIAGARGTVAGDNGLADKEPGEPAHAGNPGGRSVWYRWTAPQDGAVTMDTAGSSFDTLLAVYQGQSVDQLTEVAANDDYHGQHSLVRLPATGGAEYLIAVDGFNGATGKVVLNWELCPAPANDRFARAQTICGSRGAVHGDSATATREPGEPNHAGCVGGRSVWYRWTAPQDGQLTVDTLGSAFDTLLAVYQGQSVDQLTEVAANDDYYGRQSMVRFPVRRSAEYLIAVDGKADASGKLVLYWSMD
jgi:hypothetical protein